jgi:hypothetical protein
LIGNVSQWGEVKKKNKDRAQTKKDALADGTESYARSNRSRGNDGNRGGRGRGTDRGRGNGRGRARDTTGSRKPVAAESTQENTPIVGSEPLDTPAEVQTTSESGDQTGQASSADDASWDVVNPTEAISPAPVEQPPSSSKPDGTRTWASMLRPKPKPVVPTPKVAPIAQKQEPTPVPQELPVTQEEPVEVPSTLSPEPPIEEAAAPLSPSLPPSEPAIEISPSKDQLTESNLEQVPGSPQHPATATVVSNAGTNEVRSAAATPSHINQSQPLRPGLGGFQTTALKATSAAGRSSSYGRRIKEQQEAVVMPGNHAVDRAAVQFGSLGLGSSDELDVDDEREEPETRTQPPQHSPVAPKASLPPIPQQPTEPLKSAPGLPTPGTQTSAQEQQHAQSSTHSNYPYSQYGNLYGPPSQAGETAGSLPKGYEAFGQQASQIGHNGYPPNSQASGQTAQTSHQAHVGGFSSAANDYPSYYTSDHQRNTYQNLYGSYGQPQAPHETGSTQQKTGSSFGTSAAELPAQSATSQATQSAQTRFGTTDNQNNGHSTPNPPTSQGQSQVPGQQTHQMGQAHSQGNQHAAYPYGANQYYGNYYPNYMSQHSYGRDRPPFDDVRRYEEQYLGQNHHYGYGGNQGGYGTGPYGSKYGQPHQGYGMSPQTWDTHSGSPGNVGGFGQQPHLMTGRDNTSSLGTYGRTGSTQPSEGQQHNAGTFGGMSDAFNRSQSNYSGPGSQQPASQQNANDDTARGYSEASKGAGGPSPAPGQTAGRPNSATNVQSQTSQAQNQQGYGGYPQVGVHGQQSHYGSGLGSLGHQNANQTHQTGGYGAYSGFGGGNYYGNNSRGGWGQNYGH